MNSDPLIQLISDALELMNRAFTPTRSSWGTMLEFYHQFRKLWDRGIPVGMGLGHLIMRVEARDDFERSQYVECERNDTILMRNPNLLFIDQLGEKGRLTEKLAIIEFATALERSSNDSRLKTCADTYRYRISIIIGKGEELTEFPAPTENATVLLFNTDRWQVQTGR